MSKILTNPSGSLRLELRDDRLSAWLTIRDRNRLTDEQEILDLIEQAGIKTGFEEALRYMRKHGMEKEFDTAFPVAMCNHVKGEGKLNYYFNLDQAKHFDGIVSREELERLTCIEAGTVLADHSSNIFDRPGSIYDIYGEMLPDEDFDLNEIHKITGDNVVFDQVRHQLVAECAGFPRIDGDGRISVVKVLVLDGGVSGLAEGLRSPVDLEVRGDVASTPVTAAGKVTIRGDLTDSQVWCEGDLQVDGQIRNCVQNEVRVLGNLACAGISDSRVLCRGRIEFSGAVSNSEVVADGGVHSPRGSVSGGHLESSEDIILNTLGDQTGSPTEVEITLSPFHKALLMQMTKELIRLKQDPESNAAEIAKLNDQIRNCEHELDGELNQYLQRDPARKLKLSVDNEVYPPVRIRILRHEYDLRSPQRHLELYEKE